MNIKSKTIVIAIGGNSLIENNQEGNLEEQYQNACLTCKEIVKLVKDGHKVVITHGNGPQVGNILFRVENTRENSYDIPLDYCGAMSQGELGYLLSNVIDKYLKQEGLNIPVVSLITRTLVKNDDPAFKNPTKPIGKFYTKKEAFEISNKYGYLMKEDSGRGYRQVVASPEPVKILEFNSIKELLKNNIVIACGGGGIPVVEKKGLISGVPAVIDKDMTSSLLAKEISADILIISTAVKNVYINFGKTNQQALYNISTTEAQKHLDADEFGTGSMKPKIIAGINFLLSGGKEVIITSPENIYESMYSIKTGTHITN